MKNYLIALLFFTGVLYSQEGGGSNPNVELPEFVITGQDLINLQQTKKPETELVPVVSRDFLTPQISPEELDIKQFDGPDYQGLNLRDTVLYNTGRIKTMLGIYSLPLVDMDLSAPFKNGLFRGYVNGENIRPYVDNAERYFLNAGADISLFSDYDAAFLPGTQYRLSGDFLSRSYKLFAGNQPNLKRNLYQGSLGASIRNIYYDKFLIGAAAGYKTTTIKDEIFTEGLFTIDGFTRLNLGNFNGGVYLNYVNQTFNDTTSVNSIYNYIAIRPYAGFEFSRFLKASFGINYSHAGNNNFFSPYASVGFRFSRDVTLQGEFSPETEFIVASTFLEKNFYFNPENRPNIFLRKNNNLQGSIKYEYSRYFEINSGFRYTKYKNIPYFSDMLPDGRFSLETREADSYGIFLNLLFHKGPLGYFFASAEAGETKDKDNNYIPYFPSVISSLTYGYDFPIGLNAETNLTYRSAVFTDAANTEKLGAFINLNFNLAYKITEKLKLIASLNNILDRDNVTWKNYKEIPLDFSAGISYIW